MELAFDDRKLLLPGVHEVSLETVKQHFGQFQRSDRRPTLFAKLTEYLNAVKKAGCGHSVIIDGSFVMACVDEPDDIDLVLVLPSDWDTQAEVKPFQYNLVSKRAVGRTYPIELFVVKCGSIDEARWIEYFGQVNPDWTKQFGWPNDLRKGILRIHL
jgi:hypothetical protein